MRSYKKQKDGDAWNKKAHSAEAYPWVREEITGQREDDDQRKQKQQHE